MKERKERNKKKDRKKEDKKHRKNEGGIAWMGKSKNQLNKLIIVL